MPVIMFLVFDDLCSRIKLAYNYYLHFMYLADAFIHSDLRSLKVPIIEINDCIKSGLFI